MHFPRSHVSPKSASSSVLLRSLLIALVLVGAYGVSPTYTFGSEGIELARSSTVAITDAQGSPVGSGVVVSQGWVVTAEHVVAECESDNAGIWVRADDGAIYPATRHSSSGSLDLSLLEVAGLTNPPALFAPRDSLSTGTQVFVMGYPMSLAQLSVSSGIVSNPKQPIGPGAYVQTDASINPGNSGGPVVNEQGQVVGIAVFKIAGSSIDGMGFAVPSSDVQDFLMGTPAAQSLQATDTASGSIASNPGSGGSAASGPGAGALILVMGLAFASATAWLVSRSRFRPSDAAPVDAIGHGPAPVQVKLTIVEQGETRELTVSLPATIGRDSGAAVTLSDEQASREHAQLLVGNGGAVFVKDLASRNGTAFHGVNQTWFELPVGSSFTVGATQIVRIH